MSPKLILYGIEISPPVRAVLLTLKALELDFELERVDVYAAEHLQPKFLAKNPQHTIPTLEDEGKYIWDSHAICAYLVRKYGKDDALYPKDYYQRAVIDQRLHYDNACVFEPARQLVVAVVKGTASSKFVKEIQISCNQALDMLECFLADKAYFAGENVTIADFSIVSTYTTLLGMGLFEVSAHPKLDAWLSRMQKLPYYESANGKGIEIAKEFFGTKFADL